MTSEGSLRQTMDHAIKHYSSLFKLPSSRQVLLLLTLACIAGGMFSTAFIFPFPHMLNVGLALGLALFLMSVVADCVTSKLSLRRGTIYDLRRTLALSLFCWILWLFFIFAGAVLAFMFGLPWLVRFCLLGFSAVTILRLIVIGATSTLDYGQTLIVSILQPFYCAIPFLILWTRIGYPLTYVLLFFVFSSAIGSVSAFGFLSVLDRVGAQVLRIRSLSIFRAFVLNWVLGLNAPFEEILEDLGEERNVEVTLLKFSSSKSDVGMIVPSVHPGPFKNIGSSLLPSQLKDTLEEKSNCVACVPHGLLGHEFDLASQSQNQKVITNVVSSFEELVASEAKASPFVKVSDGLATVCCQIFGKSVFVSFTLAPHTIEDLPHEIGLFVEQEVAECDLESCVIVNAHNSINGSVDVENALASLKDVAARCIRKAKLLKECSFEIGARTVLPKEFGLRDGMGAGGITVIVVKTGEQKTAYVVIDGNNMVSGLRERVLSTLSSIGIDDGEVFTTDTHAVSALILSGRGYNPIGEAMDNDKLLDYIREVTLSALSNVERGNVACRNVIVNGVKVIGEKQIETLCLLIDRTLGEAKKVVVPIFATCGFFLMLYLLLV